MGVGAGGLGLSAGAGAGGVMRLWRLLWPLSIILDR